MTKRGPAYYAKQKRWRDKNREHVKKYKAWANNPRYKENWYKREYGLTLVDLENMRQEQGGRCAICQRHDRVLGVDHDHQTQQVRGLLCRKCNLGIAYFDDAPKVLQAAILYLLRASAHLDLRRKTDTNQVG